MRFLSVFLIAILPLSAAVPAHPRIFMPANAVAPLKARIQSDPVAKLLHGKAMERAGRTLTEEPVRYEIPDGLRLLGSSRNAIAHILHTAYAWRMTGDRKYLDRCVKELDAVCAFQDWNPKHFLDVGEMSTAVAIGYDWLYPDLTADQRKRYAEALSIKGIAALPAKPPGWWSRPTNNWAQVCNGGFMIAADAIQDVKPEQAAPILTHTREVIKACESFYKPDGAYPEGPAYWHYGSTYHILAMAVEEREAPLKLEPLWQQTSRFLIHSTGSSGMPFNYADAGPGQADVSPAQTWLATRTGDTLAIKNVRDLINRRYTDKKPPSDRFLPLTLLWLPPAKEAAAPETKAIYRGEQSLAFLRSDWSPGALWLGIKGGTPAASHGHMDSGSFVLDWAGTRWFHDLGSDDYNMPGYFGGQRFTYFRLQNLSHNTLVIGGGLQNPKAASCPVNPFQDRDGTTTFTIDLSPAYTDQCKEALRKIAFNGAKREIDFTDALKDPTGPVRWQAVTDAKVTLDGRTATLEKSGHQLVLTTPNEGVEWKLADAKPPTEREKQNAGFRILSIETPKATEVALKVKISAK
ncbi:heparinase II/III family protein [Luteolibacter ambystomatis]|uniref:Heparinase II/III family protein n=1 Tax=Luteolibacter ambystomatis TaxID=2824561 RepID=A0A975J2R6_9BACT|nr:heparinase II/III family protein [Luteolibacter ambystomatis]QUE52970.1 heparinase II/III family protein [Luteolibacter ambystomatis]